MSFQPSSVEVVVLEERVGVVVGLVVLGGGVEGVEPLVDHQGQDVAHVVQVLGRLLLQVVGLDL